MAIATHRTVIVKSLERPNYVSTHDVPFVQCVTPTDNKKPAQFFLDEIDNNPSNVRRGKVFIKPGILKLNDARQHIDRWKKVGRNAGDTIEKSGLLREFSLSQFTFQSVEQFKAVSKETESNKRKYNQSFEGYFINKNGTLNFQGMITEIDSLIGNNEYSLNKSLDKSRHRHRNEEMRHPDNEILNKVQEILLRPLISKEERDFIDNTILSNEEGAIYIINKENYPDWEYDTSRDIQATAEDLEGFELNLDF